MTNTFQLTFTLLSSPVDACAGHEHIMDDSETALAAYPLAVPVLNTEIMKHRSFVQQDPSAVYRAREGDLVGMKVVET